MPLLSVAAEYIETGPRMQARAQTPMRLQRDDVLRHVIFANLWLGSFLAAAGTQNSKFTPRQMG